MVGAREQATGVAARIAHQVGIRHDQIVVASPLDRIEIPDDGDVTRLAATARFRCNPVAIVVVELVPGRIGHEWVRAVLGGLRAEQVRFAVPAERLIAQRRLTISALGGVDAVDLTDASGCEAPDEALQVGVPIASIDGHPASPALWAATVLAAHHRSDTTVDRNSVATR